MDGVQIRQMQEAEIPVVAELWQLLSVEHQAYRAYYAVKEDGVAILRSHVANVVGKGCVILVAEKDNQIYGFVSGYVIQRNPQLVVQRAGRVDNMYVRSEYRSQGIGTLLVERLLEYFKEHGVKFVEISADVENEGALRLYKKLGFAETKHVLLMEVDD